MSYTIPGLEWNTRINQEIHGAARQLAAQGLTGKQGDKLPGAMSTVAVNHINNNPQYFRGLVRMYKRIQKEEQNT